MAMLGGLHTMKNVFLSMMAAAAMALAVAAPAQATTVTVNFTIKITEVEVPGKGADVGDTFAGSLSYDNAGVVAGVPTPLLSLLFPFFDRTITQDGPDVPAGADPLVGLEATFSGDGSLTGLFFSADVPVDFFIFVDGLDFSFDYSALDEDGEQVTIASGEGVLIPEESPIAVPLPATAPLLLSAFVVAAVVRRRAVARQ
ncbi:MAG: hypothetical protein ACK5W0_05840 [Labrys sp. (in: a-proteobacteria)]